ncbi:PepSY-associated TM helix domain-containing protein [Pusillimonas sp.]|uniref:PepSY-associated TM helix domain-containing protein n=1 Tax=Pusillimonas sp. TaxID=3040095 RepID=UPI0029A3C4BF|nr:PepSY-associated TM helix domain-containing protein [Pusillimonas sp.]MDX3893880.1 PepSY-associated TM helix domain-containing protein [Pusillimonas sp.]
MKIRKDVLDIYKAVHTWTGVIAGLALFVAFYAGALTVFKHDLAAWVAAPVQDAGPVDVNDAGRLMEETLRARPDAAKDLTLNLRATDAEPAQLSWKTPDGSRQYLANFDASGELLIREREPTAVADLVDNLHRTAGFVPGDVELGILAIGFIAMMYGLALVSGLIILLPSLVKDVFALRLGKNLKLMWKDAHNAVGFFSLPFHLVIALTTVVFAFHDQIYDTQDVFIYEGAMMDQWTLPPPRVAAPSLAAAAPGTAAASTPGRAAPGVQSAALAAPARMLADLRELSPGFEPHYMHYRNLRGERPTVWVHGVDPDYMMRYDAFAIMQPYTGEIVNASYLPGHTDGWTSWLTVFFALHFATFGGAAVQWIYFLLAVSGAFLFYSGNLLWIESRRRRAQNAGLPEQKTSVRVMSALTVGVCLGCIAGVSTSLVAGKLLHGHVASLNTWHVVVYYAVFFLSIAWAFARGASRGAVELLWLGAAATVAIPLTSLLGWLAPASGLWANTSPAATAVDVGALAGAACLACMARATRRRQKHGQPDSVWALARA